MGPVCQRRRGVVGEMHPREVRAGTGEFEEPLVLREHLDGIPEPDRGGRSRGRGSHHRALESMGWVGAHHDRRRLGLGPAKGIGHFHGFTNGHIPFLVIGGCGQVGRKTRSGHAIGQHCAGLGAFRGEVACAPLGVEPIHHAFPAFGPRRLPDPQHSVRDGMAVESLLPVLLGDGRRHAVVVSNFEALRAPGDDQIPLRRHLQQPAGGNPGPRTAGIDEDLDVDHVCTVPGAAAPFSPDCDLYARAPMTDGKGRHQGGKR